MIFCRKNIPNKHEIFLHREVYQGSKNIWEFSQIFRSNKNEGCFWSIWCWSASLRRKWIFFIYEKYSLGHFEIFQRGNDDYERDGSLGWKSRTCPNDVQMSWCKNPTANPKAKKSGKKREGKNQAITNLPYWGWISSSRFGCSGKPFQIGCP